MSTRHRTAGMSTLGRLTEIAVGREPELRFHGQQAYAGAEG